MGLNREREKEREAGGQTYRQKERERGEGKDIFRQFKSYVCKLVYLKWKIWIYKVFCLIKMLPYYFKQVIVSSIHRVM